MGGPLHLTRRFFGSLRPAPPTLADLAWVRDSLVDHELSIWAQMSKADQRHSIDVARLVDAEVTTRDSGTVKAQAPWTPLDGWFDSAPQRRQLMVAAALLHDSGKNRSQLGTFSRVLATVLRPLAPSASIPRWAEGEGIGHRLAQYWRHPEIGSNALREGGSHRLVTAWAAEHHKPEEAWTVPIELGRILRDCDDD